MKTSSALNNALPQSVNYGAAELKKFINISTIRSFFITISINVLSLFLIITFYNITPGQGGVIKSSISTKIISEGDLIFISNKTVLPESSGPKAINIGNSFRAGTYLPVPDALINPDLKEIAIWVSIPIIFKLK